MLLSCWVHIYSVVLLMMHAQRTAYGMRLSDSHPCSVKQASICNIHHAPSLAAAAVF